MKAITGAQSIEFARVYLEHLLQSWLPSLGLKIRYRNLESGNQDTRKVVRRVRMMAFHGKLMIEAMGADSVESACVVTFDHSESECKISCSGKNRRLICLRVGERGNLFPSHDTGTVDRRSAEASRQLNKHPLLVTSQFSPFLSEFGSILDCWLHRVLSPTVFVSKNRDLTTAVVQTLKTSTDGVSFILNVNASFYKMAKSLYDDQHGTVSSANLRDDILSAQGDDRGLVVVELLCPSIDSQMLVRELIEDTPSMTAYSTSKSALHKSGLFFIVHVDGDVSPEIESRASYLFH